MIWQRNELAYLAGPTCTTCQGTGVHKERDDDLTPCKCALRAMFRACYARFRTCVESGKLRSRVSFERNSGGRSFRGSWGRKEEEYLADFELVSRRELDPWHYKIFRYHFLLGAEAKLVCRRLGIERGRFFHAVYRIEARLGEAFARIEPYGLYPPRDYFQSRRGEPVAPISRARPRPSWVEPCAPGVLRRVLQKRAA